jgi:hypothetical protein
MRRNDTLDRDRLARVLGMLGSAHDGEVAAAGRIAHEIVRSAGATWFDVVAAPPAIPPRRATEPDSSFREIIDFCLSIGSPTPWELEFLHSLKRRQRPLSGKQAAVLYRIFTKARGEP